MNGEPWSESIIIRNLSKLDAAEIALTRDLLIAGRYVPKSDRYLGSLAIKGGFLGPLDVFFGGRRLMMFHVRPEFDFYWECEAPMILRSDMEVEFVVGGTNQGHGVVVLSGKIL